MMLEQLIDPTRHVGERGAVPRERQHIYTG